MDWNEKGKSRKGKPRDQWRDFMNNEGMTEENTEAEKMWMNNI